MTTPPYHPVVLSLLRQQACNTVLDAPCGKGWLGKALQDDDQEGPVLDGVGLWEFPEPQCGYRTVLEHDLDEPLPDLKGQYDAVVCGEALHLLTNPGVVLASFRKQLRSGGMLIITTPNTWHMRSRLQFMLRGFHSGFSPMVGKRRGDYIAYIPWSFNQLHLILGHYGYTDITLHDVDEPKPKRFIEHILAFPGRMYSHGKKRKAQCPEERRYWSQLGSAQSVHGRWLVVSAKAP